MIPKHFVTKSPLKDGDFGSSL